MSTLIVKVQSITEVLTHPNADKLELAIIGGTWQTVVKKDEFNPGDLVVFVPPDSILPRSLMDWLGITNYCSELPQGSPERLVGSRRVRATRLRGEKSFGTIISYQQVITYLISIGDTGKAIQFTEGEDFADILGITKWEPPEKCLDGDSERPYSPFHFYTEIENIKNYPDVLQNGEEVVITEKIHGCLHTDSLILMGDGSEKRIVDVKPGDVIVGYDEVNKVFVSTIVSKNIIKSDIDTIDWYKLKFDNNRTLICTGDHLILTNEGWIKAENLTSEHNLI